MNIPKRLPVILLAVVLVFLAGRFSASLWSGGEDGHEGHDHSAMGGATDSAPTFWTCPMHPEIRMPEFGDCPKCGMDLVQLRDGDETGPRQLAMSPDAVALAQIRTEPVERAFLTRSVRMVGKIDYDQTRIRTIAARVEGRLERLFVDYEGIRVQRGDHLVRLYSPALLTAQQELIEAKNSLDSTSNETSQFLRESTRRGYEAARRKLLLWGLTDSQVDEIVERGTVDDHILLRSPTEGVVIQKAMDEGDYVAEGTAIYKIADLSKLWVMLDAYEQDLAWLRYGQSVSITTEAYPGRVFDGVVAFIDPTVDERTRTVRVRVNVENPNGDLKPGMFARGLVRARIGGEGQVLEPRLEGKWISPMHPEIVKDGPGQCDICGMDLVPAESFLPDPTVLAMGKPLVVPTSAVLITGRRAVAYVEVPGSERPTFEGREVVLGPRADDHYIVLRGLAEHERVVVNGAFRIDSSMQIRAKPSMMSMPGEERVFDGPDTASFRASLEPLYEAYATLQSALASDDPDAATAAFDALSTAAAGIDEGSLRDVARSLFREERVVLLDSIARGVGAEGLEAQRLAFRDLSRSVLELERRFQHQGGAPHYEAFCPMAFDNEGASWIQTGEEIANPYFGASMFRCGEIRDVLPGTPTDRRAADDRSGATETDTDAPGDRTPDEVPSDTPDAIPDVTSDDATGGDQDVPAAVTVSGLTPVLDHYLDLQTALAGDDFAAARRAFAALGESAAALAVEGEGDSVEALRRAVTDLGTATATGVDGIETLRARFEDVTAQVLTLVRGSGMDSFGTLYRMHCPMAFDNRGAEWLQRSSTLANPYFGSRMLRCGTTEEVLGGAGDGR